ncbi:hypothetical protein [Actinoplanes sp. NPDC051851]|uniref:hypothetical protein n=1 Tax=Actinoplanes sp. NPDC051851 TaxID=3154753 RepID=UPI0034288DC5
MPDTRPGGTPFDRAVLARLLRKDREVLHDLSWARGGRGVGVGEREVVAGPPRTTAESALIERQVLGTLDRFSHADARRALESVSATGTRSYRYLRQVQGTADRMTAPEHLRTTLRLLELDRGVPNHPALADLRATLETPGRTLPDTVREARQHAERLHAADPDTRDSAWARELARHLPAPGRGTPFSEPEFQATLERDRPLLHQVSEAHGNRPDTPSVVERAVADSLRAGGLTAAMTVLEVTAATGTETYRYLREIAGTARQMTPAEHFTTTLLLLHSDRNGDIRPFTHRLEAVLTSGTKTPAEAVREAKPIVDAIHGAHPTTAQSPWAEEFRRQYARHTPASRAVAAQQLSTTGDRTRDTRPANPERSLTTPASATSTAPPLVR